MAFDIRDETDPHNEEFDEYEDVKQSPPPKFYRRRKFWIFCIPNAIIAIIVAVILALYVIMPKIAQGLMNKATISFTQIDITNPTETSMDLVLKGAMDKTGPFHADISFPGPVTVSWNGKILGTTLIPGTSTASGGHGDLDLQSSFTVTDSAAFAEFSSFMLNSESFVWHLEGKLNVKALSRTVKNLDLSKDITVNAFNGLPGVTIQRFALPGDDPTGKGINVEIDTLLTNPSAIQMFMGDLTLAISYKDVLAGYVTATGLTMVRGPQTMTLKGVLIPQNTTEGLAVISELMSMYIGNVAVDTIATGYEVKPDGVNNVAWLSSAVKNLKLIVKLQSPQPLQLIKALNLGALGLTFTPETAYQPLTTSTGVLANYSLPDGFNFNIQFTQVANSFQINRNNVAIANLNSTYNPSTSDMAAGTLTFDLLSTPLLIPDGSHPAFQEFNRDLTVGADLTFNVIGQASVFANTSIGTVNLVNIPFNATTGLAGLQSLGNPAPTITELQVISGTSTALGLAITVVIINPSSISLVAGDITLALVYNGATLGTVTMPGLSIVPGSNTVQATASIDPAASPEGIELLTLYTSGAGASVGIAGTPTSTAIDSLSLAFGALSIGSQMPGLPTKLLAGASLIVLDTTLVNGVAQTVVTVNNPFVPPMSIVSIDSTITYNGLSLGTVSATYPTPPVIPGTGQGTITAGLALNTNPEDLVALIRAQAVANGLNTDAFDGLLSLMHGGNPPASLFDGFNVADFTLKAMSGLSVDITLTTTVKVGDYLVTIPYTQTGVPTATDETILKLIPLVGTPIAQILVDQSTIAFDSVKINDPAETSFLTDVIGTIGNTGPLDAKIQFPQGVTISYSGKAFGSMAMPTVDAVAGKGADLNLVGVEFAVSDSAAFAEFNVFAVNNEKFDWTISASGIVVSAMGVSLPGVAMTKVVTLDGFNKLQGLELQSYLINKIDDEGLHMSISATISNPSTIGMTIPSAIFNTISHGAVLGPAVATGMTLVPHGSSSFALNATIQAGHGDLTPYLTGIFQNALSGIASPLTAQGTAAPGVSWLDAAIKSLTIDTALPPLAEPPIEAVTINNMSMDFTCPTCDYAPTTVSSITARTNLPFAMDVPISQLRQNVNILDTNGVLVGTLNTEYSAATATGNLVSTTTGSSPLVIADGAHEVYGDFVKDLTAATTYDLGLQGTADSFLNLGALGTIEVKGIKIDVRTSLKGLQGIKDVTYVTRLAFSIAGQFSMVATLANIHNPSDLTLKIGTLKFVTDPDGIPEHAIGVTEIAALELVPGDNQALSITTIQMSLDYAWPFIANLTSALVEPTPIYLSTDSQISSNPALVAGLSEVSTILLIPPQLPESRSALPYGDTWTIRATPSTADDGIIEIGSTINNPYFNTTLHVDDVAPPYPPEGTTYGDDLVALTLTTSLDPYVNFDVLSSGPFDILPGQSKEIYFKMKPRSLNPTTQFDLAVKLANVFKTGGDGYINIRTLIPDIRLGDNPVAVKALWMSRDVYPATVGFLKARGGADFDYFVQYAQKQIPVAAPAVTTTSGATSPTTIDSTVAPTATDAPTVPTTDSSVNVPSVAPTAPASPAAPSPSIVPTP